MIKWQPTFVRFFGTINKFVDLFHYRVRSAKSFDLYQKTAPHKLALLKKEFAEQLERFRSMPGTRIERMRILKEIRVSNGEQVTIGSDRCGNTSCHTV